MQVLADQQEEHPETGEQTTTVEFRETEDGVQIVNTVQAEDNPEDFETTEDGAAVVATFTPDEFDSFVEDLRAIFVDESAEEVEAPQGDTWECGQHPLFGSLVFKRTDDTKGHAVIPQDNIKRIVDQLS